VIVVEGKKAMMRGGKEGGVLTDTIMALLIFQASMSRPIPDETRITRDVSLSSR